MRRRDSRVTPESEFIDEYYYDYNLNQDWAYVVLRLNPDKVSDCRGRCMLHVAAKKVGNEVRRYVDAGGRPSGRIRSPWRFSRESVKAPVCAASFGGCDEASLGPQGFGLPVIRCPVLFSRVGRCANSTFILAPVI